MNKAEFSRPVRFDRIGAVPAEIEIVAEPAERAALARRFGLLALHALEARLSVRREGEGVVAQGRVTGAVVQPCIASAEPVPGRIDEEVRLRFVPDGGADGDVELDNTAVDTMFFDGAEIDLGEAAAETLALALDPYPRSPEADAVLRRAGVLREEEAAPSGALAGLKDLLG